MSHFFYFIGLLIFLLNFNLITNFFHYLKIKEWFKSFQKVTNKFPTNKDFKKGEFNKFKNYNGVVALNFLWFFFGVITLNWKIFFIGLILNITIDLITRLIGEFKFLSKILSLIKFIIINLIIFTIVMNHFHWNVDLYNLLITFIRK
jgi:hypothetical protein